MKDWKVLGGTEENNGTTTYEARDDHGKWTNRARIEPLEVRRRGDE